MTLPRRFFLSGSAAALALLGPGLSPLAATVTTPQPKKKKKKKTVPLKDLPYTPLEQIPNHRQMMRDMLVTLATYAKSRRSDFQILIRNAPELIIKERREWLWETGRDPEGNAMGKYTPEGSLFRDILKPLDGMLFDGLTCGFEEAGRLSDPEDRAVARDAAAALSAQGRILFGIDYCADREQIEAALLADRSQHVIPIIDLSGNKSLSAIAPNRPIGENPRHITALGQAANALPCLDGRNFPSRASWIAALTQTNYDVVLVETYWRGTDPLTAADVRALKYKALGSRRQVIAVLPVGRARDTAAYWQADWQTGKPDWLFAPDPQQPGKTVVQYWDAAWKEIVGKMMKMSVDLGFDGVLFDEADSYLPFEDMMPVE